MARSVDGNDKLSGISASMNFSLIIVYYSDLGHLKCDQAINSKTKKYLTAEYQYLHPIKVTAQWEHNKYFKAFQLKSMFNLLRYI